MLFNVITPQSWNETLSLSICSFSNLFIWQLLHLVFSQWALLPQTNHSLNSNFWFAYLIPSLESIALTCLNKQNWRSKQSRVQVLGSSWWTQTGLQNSLLFSSDWRGLTHLTMCVSTLSILTPTWKCGPPRLVKLDSVDESWMDRRVSMVFRDQISLSRNMHFDIKAGSQLITDN